VRCHPDEDNNQKVVNKLWTAYTIVLCQLYVSFRGGLGANREPGQTMWRRGTWEFWFKQVAV